MILYNENIALYLLLKFIKILLLSAACFIQTWGLRINPTVLLDGGTLCSKKEVLRAPFQGENVFPPLSPIQTESREMSPYKLDDFI